MQTYLLLNLACWLVRPFWWDENDIFIRSYKKHSLNFWLFLYRPPTIVQTIARKQILSFKRNTFLFCKKLSAFIRNFYNYLVEFIL